LEAVRPMFSTWASARPSCGYKCFSIMFMAGSMWFE
jgi:hypothetical protein